MVTGEELLNVLRNISEEQIIDFVDSECKEVFMNSYLSPGFQGWFSRVVVNEDGDMYITGSMSNSTGLISEYEGRSTTVATIDSWNEFNDDIVLFDYLNELNEIEKKKLYEYLLELYDNDDNLSIDDFINDCIENSAYYLDEIYDNLFNDKYEELKKDYAENLWYDFGRDNLISEITSSIDEFLKRHTEEL